MILNGFKKNIFERKKLADESPHSQWQKSVFFGIISKVRPESKWKSDVPWLGPSRGVVSCMPTVPEVGLRLGTYLIYKRKRRTSTLRCTYLTGLSWSCYLENSKQNYLSDLLTTWNQEMLAHLKGITSTMTNTCSCARDWRLLQGGVQQAQAGHNRQPREGPELQ